MKVIVPARDEQKSGYPISVKCTVDRVTIYTIYENINHVFDIVGVVGVVASESIRTVQYITVRCRVPSLVQTTKLVAMVCRGDGIQAHCALEQMGR